MFETFAKGLMIDFLICLVALVTGFGTITALLFHCFS